MTRTNDSPAAGSPIPAVSLLNVSKIYGAVDRPVHALRSVNLDLHSGEFVAIMGPSGSGKSTLMNVCAGLDEPTDGDVLLGGTSLTGRSDRERTILRRNHIGFIFQSFNLVPTLTAAENVRLPFLLRGEQITRDQQAWIDELVADLRIAPWLEHLPGELSGGQQQRVAIARAMGAQPSIILADEPTGSLDIRTGRDVLALLSSAARNYGQGIAMVTHDPVAAAAADRLVVVADGALVGESRGLEPAQIAQLLIDLELAA